jgi:hypothetical protein
MKKIFFLSIVCCSATLFAGAQEFNKQLATARTAYKAGKLDDSRFAMQQMLQELDMMTGRAILKVLPATLNSQAIKKDKDEVSGASGFTGIVVHREYGTTKPVELEIITNSPMLAAINGLLSLPFIANNADQKVIRINGYKALVQKVDGETEGTANYEVQLPLTNSLLTLKAPGYAQDDVVKMANALPVAEIVKLIQ